MKLDPRPIGRLGTTWMRRSILSLLACLSLLSPVSAAGAGLPAPEIPPGEHRPGDTGDALVRLRVDGIDDLWDFVDDWERAGARFPHVYPPDVLIGDVPERIERALSEDPRVERLFRKEAALAAKSAGARDLLVDSWSAELGAPPPEPAKQDAPFGDLLLGPAFDPSAPLPESGVNKTTGGLVRKYGSAFGASMIQTSELLMGKVVVGVFLPDAAGGAYSDPEISTVYQSVRGAMDFWAGKARYPGVRFVYDLRTKIPCSRNFHTTPPHLNNKAWVAEILESIGYDLFLKGTEYGPVYEYLDSLRVRTRSEWGVVFFIPKAMYFPGAPYTAYAYLGGPFLVVPSGSNGRVTPHGSGSMGLSDLVIHESGHLFWALDEYEPGAGTSQPCHVRSGYLDIQNRNSLYHDYSCDRHVPCAMDNPAGAVCQYTLGQMGHWDTDEDGIPDFLDTHPFVTADSLADTITTAEPVLTGVAAEMPVVNNCSGGGSGAGKEEEAAGARPNITFNSIDHVVYRIDDMTDDEGSPLWFYGDPDGGWGGDSTRVHFSFVPDSLTGGLHTIRISAVNTVGNWSTWGEHRVTVFVKAIALRDFAAVPDYDGRVKLTYRIWGAAFGARADLYRRNLAGGEEERVSSFVLADNGPSVLYDSEPRPGESYRYRLEANALGERWDWEADVVSPAPIARGEHLSLVTPNPFHSSTMISFKVPRGDLSDRPGGGGTPKPGPTVPTNPDGEAAPQLTAGTSARYKIVRVEIDIYDLAGRRVRHFPPVHSYEGFYTEPYVWDGRDDSGKEVAQGVYFARMRAGDDVYETRKIVLIR